MKANLIPITKSLACRRKYYKRHKVETNKKKAEKRKKKKKTLTLPILILKKNTIFSWLTH